MCIGHGNEAVPRQHADRPGALVPGLRLALKKFWLPLLPPLRLPSFVDSNFVRMYVFIRTTIDMDDI